VLRREISPSRISLCPCLTGRTRFFPPSADFSVSDLTAGSDRPAVDCGHAGKSGRLIAGIVCVIFCLLLRVFCVDDRDADFLCEMADERGA